MGDLPGSPGAASNYLFNLCQKKTKKTLEDTLLNSCKT